MSLYTRTLRPALFSLDAERAHDLTIAALRRRAVVRTLEWLAPAGSGIGPPEGGPHDTLSGLHNTLSQEVLGLDCRHPLGLAAGLDKQGVATAAWAALGFALAEVGTVTPRPQPGNPRPRLFRLPRDRAIINRFGFNSAGAETVTRNLSSGTRELVLGINLGKNKETPNECAADDYLRAVDALHPHADYFVVNVSSPNTERLRDLQESRALRALMEQVTARVRAAASDRTIPVLVKVSPDAPPADLLQSVSAALEGGAAGVIATNTTVGRANLATPPPLAAEAGGLSGLPLKTAANEICRLLFSHLGRRVPIIGVGGIWTADDAYERIRSGATLLQIYSVLIYEGPGVVRRIVNGLSDRLERDGFSHVSEAIGVDVH